MSDQGIYEPMPQPPGYQVLGNLFDLRGAETPTQALMKLAREYGPIFRFHVGSRRLTVISGFDLVDELCDEERFDKMLGRAKSTGVPSSATGSSPPGPRSPTGRRHTTYCSPTSVCVRSGTTSR